MLNIRAIRDDVVSRLKCFKTVDEEMIHYAYESVLREHVEGSISDLRKLAMRVREIRASTKDNKWVMIERAQLDEVIKELEDIALEIGRGYLLSPIKFARTGT